MKDGTNSTMKFMKVCYLDGGGVMRTNEHITEAGGCPFIYQIARLENFQYNIDATIVPFVRGQLNKLEIAFKLTKRRNLSETENWIAQHFEELFVKTKYKEAVKFVKANTLAKFHNVRVKDGQTPQWLQYFAEICLKSNDNGPRQFARMHDKVSMEKAICRWDKEMAWFYCSTTSPTGAVKAEDDNMKEVRNILQMGSNFRYFGSNNVNEHSSQFHFMLCIMANSKNIKIVVEASAYVDAFGADISVLEVKKKRQRQYLEVEIDIDALVDLGNIAIGGIIDKFVQLDEDESAIYLKLSYLQELILMGDAAVSKEPLEGIVMSLVEERKGDQAIDVTVSALTGGKGNGVVVVRRVRSEFGHNPRSIVVGPAPRPSIVPRTR
ncbi:hypothetical protein V6N11_068075 [Hibiscus sabdariffa]|uniref:Uncharacterized protein n=1 Tax=Hibiscus sabdariffa TaxID=183260 RepID=A0ABR2STK8_9ROSI